MSHRADDARRIVVTGLGAVSGFGAGAVALMDGVLSTSRAIGEIRLFQLAGAKSAIASEVPAGILDGVFTDAQREGSSRTDAMAALAAREALGAAGLLGLADRDGEGARVTRAEPVDLVVGGTTAGMFETEELLTKLDGDLDREGAARMRTHPLSSTADKLHEVIGPFVSARTVCCACTSGAFAIALGATWLESGVSSIVLAGGADALCRLTYSGFGALSVLSPEPCQPFGRARSGLTLGEGAAFLVLETLAHAKARGRTPIAELAGFALGGEAHHITNPEPGGGVAASIMSRAIAMAGLSPRDVGYVNAHGTGTQQNDANESLAIRKCFAEARPRVSSSKGQIGHTLGAAGALEAAISVMTLERGVLPATAGLSDPDLACDVDHVVVAEPRPDVDAVITNSFGFGGTGASLVFTKVGRGAPVSAVKRRAVVTGVAAILPSGVVSGRGAARIVSSEGAASAAEKQDVASTLDQAVARRMDWAAKLQTVVVVGALSDADGSGTPLDRSSCVVVSGTAFGNVDGSMRFMKRVLERGAAMASPADFPNLVPSSPVSHAAIYAKLGGAAVATPDLSTTAESAVATAVELVEGGVTRAAIGGSVEDVSVLAERVLAPLLGVRRLSTYSEGASALVIEEEEAAAARGARPLASIRIIAAQRGDEASGRASLGAPLEGDVVIHDEGTNAAEVLRSSRWAEGWADVPRYAVGADAGDHVGMGGVALAGAAAFVAEGKARRALVVGASIDRRYAFLLERMGEDAT